MSVQIQDVQLKRGNQTNVLSSTLLRGEPAIAIDTKELYIGTGSGKIKISDVEFYSSLVNFPVTGILNKLYIDSLLNIIYKWDGSSYVSVISGSVGDHFINSHTDVDTTPPVNGQMLIWDSSINKYKPGSVPAPVPTVEPPTEPDTGQPWVDPNTSSQYYWDGIRLKWLSYNHVFYSFYIDGNIRNSYIPTSFSSTHYTITQSSTIVSINCVVESVQEPNKILEIHDDGIVIGTIPLGTGLTYINMLANIDISPNSELQVWVPSDPLNSRINTPSISLEVAVHYIP